MTLRETSIEMQIETRLDLSIYARPLDQPETEWQDYDQGAGIFNLAAGYEYGIRARNIDDDDLAHLCRRLAEIKSVTYLNLAENRKVTDEGAARIAGLPWLTRLNLSSCTIHNSILTNLRPLKKLQYLDLSYCNRLGDDCLRALKFYQNLKYLDLQGCVRITHAGVKRFSRRGLTVHQ